MRIVILVSYNEQLVKRAFGFVVYVCMQPCSHADRRVVALVASLLYVLVLLCVSHCLLCVGTIAHVVLSLCVLALLCTLRCFCALMHRVPVANKSKRALLKKTRNRAKAGM